MAHRTKRLLNKDHEQENATHKKKCTSLVSDCLMRVPIVLLHNLKLELDHQSKQQNVKRPDHGHHSDHSRQQVGAVEDRVCTSPTKESSKVPVVQLYRLNIPPDLQEQKSDREQQRDRQEHALDDGGSRLSSSSPAHNECLASNTNITNHHQQEGAVENRVCTSPTKESSKVPVVQLYRLNIPPDLQEQKSARKSDSEQQRDRQDLQQNITCVNRTASNTQTEQQTSPPVTTVTNSYTYLKANCMAKQPVIKLSRLKMQPEEERWSTLDSEPRSHKVPSPSSSQAHGVALSPVTPNALIPPDTVDTRTHDQQEGDPKTVRVKQPTVQLIRLNVKPQSQLEKQTMDEDDSENHSVHSPDSSPLNVDAESVEEQSVDDSDSDTFDELDLENFSAYELERIKNIKENSKFLKTLKLREVVSSLRQPSKPRPCTKREKPQSDMVIRRSVRLQGIKSSGESVDGKRPFAIQDQIQMPPGPIKMLPSDDVDHGAWLSFQDTWESISSGELLKPSRYQCRKPISYKNQLQSLTLEKRAITCAFPASVCSVAVHPSHTRTLVAAGDYCGKVGFWDLKHQSAGVYVFPLHSSRTNCVAFSPSNAKHLLSLGYEGTIRCGDISRCVFDEIYREEERISYFDFLSADSSVLLVSHVDSKLSVVDRRTRTTSSEICGGLDLKFIHTVNVHPLNRDLCVVAGTCNALIYDVRKLRRTVTQPVMSLLGHTRSVSSAFFSPHTGKHVLTCCFDGYMRAFNVEDFKQKSSPVSAIGFRDCGKNVLPALWDPKQEGCFGQAVTSSRRINIFRMKTRLLHSLTSEYLTSRLSAFAFHPTRNLVVSGTNSGLLCVWKKWKQQPDLPEEGKSLE